MASSAENGDSGVSTGLNADGSVFGLTMPKSSSRLNPPQRSSSSLRSISSLSIGETEFAANGNNSAAVEGHRSTDRLYTASNKVVEAEMASVDSLASRPHTYRQLVIIDDITYFSTMYARFTTIPFTELSNQEVQARVAVLRRDLLAEDQIPKLSLFRIACIHSILAHIEHPRYVPSVAKLDVRPHLKIAATAIATIRALGISEADQRCIRLLEERNQQVRSHWESGLNFWQEVDESDFTPGRIKIWWEKMKHRGLFGGGRHALGWEDPGPEGAGGRNKERKERGSAGSADSVVDAEDSEEEPAEVRMFC